MLPTRFSRRKALRALALCAALLPMAACGPMPGTRAPADDGAAIDPNQPVKVALLVPAGSGDPTRELIARNLVNAANLAVSDIQNANIDLSVFNTQGTSAGGAQAAQNAVAAKADIIVGPLFSTATAGAAPVARAAGIKVLSMSNNVEVAGPDVYLLGNTFENTADALVGYARGQGLSNFGIVYSRGLEGEAARDAASAAISRRGGALVATESYSLSVEAIERAASAIAGRLTSSGANAVILTDGPTGGLGFIAEGLAQNGISPANVQYLGMQKWSVSGEALLLGSLQSGVFAAPDPTFTGAFEGRYANTYGSSPHEVASVAFDGLAAVGAMIAEARTRGRAPFSTQQITNGSGFVGANGPFRFLPDGHNQRNLAIYQVSGGQAVVVRGASRSFGRFGS